MCGIAGSYRGGTRAEIERMISQIGHRGPDGIGFDETPGCVLGHARLAIVDVEGGAQPIADAGYRISFNGEIYNHAALRASHLAGEPLRTRSDTEVVLRLYERLGPASVKLLDGMFAIAIVGDDGLFLARDPLGIKPLYYGAQGETLYFASEIKALALVTDDIREFPAGCWFHSQAGVRRYYEVGAPLLKGPEVSSEEQAPPAIRSALRRAVQAQLMSDVPLGVSLSGGLDSSIVSLLAREALEQVDSFAVGVEGSPDLAAAREVAAFLGTRHHESVYTRQDILHALPEVLFHLESFDPALVRSAVPNYFLSRLAADHVKVILTGEGADELYAGYAYLNGFDTPESLQSELVAITGALHNTNLQRGDRMSMAHGLEARPPFLAISSVDLALSLPAGWKLHRKGRAEKALLRRAFEGLLPDHIVYRRKEKFSQGAGSSEMVAEIADDAISDAEFFDERRRLSAWDYRLPNKEALYYYRLLRRDFHDEWILPNMGRSRSL
jgi:asparagine synthase (glutamine-hydrolysing)